MGRMGHLGDSVPEKGQAYETNPISGGPTGPHHSSIPLFQHSRPLPIVRNKAKLGQAGVSGGQDVGTSAGQMRQTNPIGRRAARGASPLWAKSYGELDIQRTSARQSQLPEAGHRGGVHPSGGPRDLEQTIASGARQSAAVCRHHPTGPATGQSRCLGCRRGVDSSSGAADTKGRMNANE
jgi:hypothetical protein